MEEMLSGESGESNMDLSELDRWTVGCTWKFDRISDQTRLDVYNDVTSSRKGGKAKPILIEERAGRKIVIQAEFIEKFNAAYLIKKGKRARDDTGFELICDAEDPKKRSRNCPFGAEFKWTSSNDAILIAVCHDHGENCPTRGAVPQVRSKNMALLCAAKTEVYEALKECPNQSKKAITITKANIEGVGLSVVPSQSTVKRHKAEIRSARKATDSDVVFQDLCCLEFLTSWLQERDPEGFYQVEKELKNVEYEGRMVECPFLKRVTVIPSMAKHFWTMSPFKVASADATHLTNVFGGVMNTIGSFDGNQRRITLALSISACENRDNWEQLFQTAMSNLFVNDIHLLISDRDKGLIAADDVLPNCVHSFCAVHIARNLGLANNAGYHDITGLAKAATVEEYEDRLRMLGEKYGKSKPSLVSQLEELSTKFCTSKLLMNEGKNASLPFETNFGITSNNISEQENSALGEVRSLPYTAAILEFLSRMEALMHERRVSLSSLKAQNYSVVRSAVETVASQAKQMRETGFRVEFRSCNSEGNVFTSWNVLRRGEDNSIVECHPVQLFPLAEKWHERIRCSCNHFLATGIPCRHASSVLAYCASSINTANSFLVTGSTKQVDMHHNILAREEYVRKLETCIDEDKLPRELWHQYLIFKYLNEEHPEKHVTCSSCSLRGHRADGCKQSTAVTALYRSTVFKEKLDSLVNEL